MSLFNKDARENQISASLAEKAQQASLNDVAINVKDFGAIGDGISHPLSQFFPTLTTAQMKYPHATALTDEIDWAALQAAINSSTDNGLGILCNGQFIINRAVIFPQTSGGTYLKPITIEGKSSNTINAYGGGLTTFEFTGTGNLFELRGSSGTDATNSVVSFKNFTAFTNASGQIPVTGTIGINANRISGSVYENVTFKYFDTGIKVADYAYYSVWEQVKAYYCNTGFSLNKDINGVNFSRCTLSSCGVGFSTNNGAVNVVLNICIFESNQTAVQSTYTLQLTLNDCYFESNIITVSMTESTAYNGVNLSIFGGYVNVPTNATNFIVAGGNVMVLLSGVQILWMPSAGAFPLVAQGTGGKLFHLLDMGVVFLSTQPTNMVPFSSGGYHIGSFGKDKAYIPSDLYYKNNANIKSGALDENTTLNYEFPYLATLQGKVQYFRNTNTTGPLRISYCKGDGTSTEQIALDVKNARGLFFGGIGVGNSATATTLGTLTKKMQVFDQFGNSLGYVPIYSSIT